MFLPMSCTSPFTVASTILPLLTVSELFLARCALITSKQLPVQRPPIKSAEGGISFPVRNQSTCLVKRRDKPLVNYYHRVGVGQATVRLSSLASAFKSVVYGIFRAVTSAVAFSGFAVPAVAAGVSCGVIICGNVFYRVYIYRYLQAA